MKTKVLREYDVYVLGQPIVDLIVPGNDDFLKEHLLKQGDTIWPEKNAVDALAVAAREKEGCVSCAGGSETNTVAMMAALGSNIAYSGCVGSDAEGRVFVEDLQVVGINCDDVVVDETDNTGTGQCISVISGDGERAMATFLGVSGNLAATDINEEKLKQSTHLYLVGYLWGTESSQAAVKKAIECARENDVKVVLSLSASFVVEAHGEAFRQLIQEGKVDIVLGNKEEFSTLYPGKNLGAVLEETSGLQVAAVTDAKNGVTVGFREEGGSITTETVKAEQFEDERIKDRTGAGDVFAGGFLHGMCKGWNMEACCAFGNLVASKIIQQFGARYTDYWSVVEDEFKSKGEQAEKLKKRNQERTK